jgi:hypothetical protein
MDTESKNILCAYYKAYRRANGREKAKRLKLEGCISGWFTVTTFLFGYSKIRKGDLVKAIETLNSRPAKD